MPCNAGIRMENNFVKNKKRMENNFFFIYVKKRRTSSSISGRPSNRRSTGKIYDSSFCKRQQQSMRYQEAFA